MVSILLDACLIKPFCFSDTEIKILSNSERTQLYAEIKRQKRAEQKYESAKRRSLGIKTSNSDEKTKMESKKRQVRRERRKELIKANAQYERERKRNWRKKKMLALQLNCRITTHKNTHLKIE